jgi:2-oxoisovalerate dehydrogenase E2 component (dihydrolipoyl transacylase)
MEEVDMTELTKVRNDLREESGIKLSYMPLFIKAFSLALLEFPILNSHYSAENPFEYNMIKNHNISIAIDSPQGLVVPNIKNCQDLTISQIQLELNRIRNSALEGKVSPSDLYEGTVCLSNIGNIAGTYTAPIILPPQVCIVAIGKMQEIPRFVVDDYGKKKISPRKIVYLSD